MYIWIKLSTFDSRYKFESDTITNLIALVEHKIPDAGFLHKWSDFLDLTVLASVWP